MATPSNIQYLQNHEIDRARWDACIENAENGLIYGYSFYLDTMCDHWDALVLDDYKAVMPLPWRKKWSIKYVYQPAFIQRLSIFGNNIQELIIKQFYLEASQRFQFIHFNQSVAVDLSNTKWLQRGNQIIHLSDSYKDIRNRFSKQCLKNIHKAEERGCSYSTQISTNEVVDLYKKAYGIYQKGASFDYYEKVISLLNKAVLLKRANLGAVIDKNGSILFGGAVFTDSKRHYYIIGAPTVQGREKRATYFFINTLLKQYANTEKVFDFEGSDIPNVANFYQRFGPMIEHYYEMKMNRLPILLKWIKT